MEQGKRKAVLNIRELNAACSEGNEKAVRELLRSGRTPTAKSPTLKITRDKEAHFPIHTACQRQKSGKIVEMLLTSGSFSVEDQTVNWDTALHVACTSNNLEAVQGLLSYSELRSFKGCMKQNKEGNTPLHLAALCCSSDITAFMLQQLTETDNIHSLIAKKNKNGQTCLGIAIKNKDWPTAQILLTHSHSNPASLCSNFLSMADFNLQALDCEPIDVFVLGDQESGKSTLISTLLQASQPAGLMKFASMAVSSLISSRSTTKTCKVSIVPSTVEYRRHRGSQCAVTFHDVNNYHGYSQEAIFKCTSEPLEALYIISVDMTTKNIEGSVLYWLHFLYRQLAEYTITCVTQSPTRTRKKLKILVVGTSNDLVSSSHSHLLSIDDLLLQERISEEFASQFSWCGDHYVNAKRISSCSAVLSKIHDTCGHLHSDCFNSETKSLLAQTHILANLLLKEYSSNSIITFNDIVDLVQSTESTLCEMLPKSDPCKIKKLCRNLKHFSRFKVLTLTRARKKIAYVIFDYKYLLRSIEQGFSELSLRAQHGIVAKQDMKDVFKDYRFIISFLEHLNLCEKVSSHGLEIMKRSIRSSRRSRTSRSHGSANEVLVTDLMPHHVCHKRSKSESDSYIDFAKMIKVEPKSIMSSVDILSPGTLSNKSCQTSSQSIKRPTGSHRKEVPLYFLPTLISRVQSRELWDGNDEYAYGFAWSLVPHDGDGWFLSSKFVTVMLFRLLFSFSPSPTTVSKFPLERTCELWDQGIVWCDPHGARICVAISDNNKITLSMQCLKGSEMACLSIRNEIMSDIKQKLKEIHPDIITRELFLPLEGNKFPVFDPLKSNVAFDKEEIRKAIVEDRTALCTKAKQHKHYNSLLYFEPVCFLGQQLLQELFDAKNSERLISDDFCMQFAKNLSCKWTLLAKHWETILQKYYIDSLKDSTTMKGSPHDTAMEMLTRLRDIDYINPSERVDTYGGLQKSLFEISIFSRDFITRMLGLS